ncbi:hypothetical protein BV898_16947 [Hypsibius exemplaris]|uniref:Uncharacterized protein n=1 Tax=Hypsibius exemplaris TaxID=2072580 RepID=A0A9X6NEN3_HYPEX|nr:hypothetical protein BV898_16947 [Hypsibius exemplaris]
MSNSSGDEVPSDYEDDFEGSPKDLKALPGHRDIDIFPISEYFSDGPPPVLPPRMPSLTRNELYISNTEGPKLGEREAAVADIPSSPRRGSTPASPAPSENVRELSQRSDADASDRPQQSVRRNSSLRNDPGNANRSRHDSPNEMDRISVLQDSRPESAQPSGELSVRSSLGSLPDQNEPSDRQDLEEIARISKPRTMSVANLVLPLAKPVDLLNQRQIVPALNLPQKSRVVIPKPKLKVIEKSKATMPGKGNTDKVEKVKTTTNEKSAGHLERQSFKPRVLPKNSTEAAVKPPTAVTAVAIPEMIIKKTIPPLKAKLPEKQLARVRKSKYASDNDDDFPEEITEFRRIQGQGRGSRSPVKPAAIPVPVRAKSVGLVPRKRTVAKTAEVAVQPPVVRSRSRQRSPLSLEEKAEQERRYQLLKRKTQARLKTWGEKQAELEKLDKVKRSLNSTYTVELKKDLNPVQGKVLRERQSSVRIPRFAPKKLEPSKRPATSLKVRKRNDSFSSNRVAEARPSSTALPNPTFIRGLIDFTVNDSKHSPQESYWLYLLHHPEGLVPNESPDHLTTMQPTLWKLDESLAGEPGDLEDDLTRRTSMDGLGPLSKAKLKVFDRLLLDSSELMNESQHDRRRRYGDNIRRRLRFPRTSQKPPLRVHSPVWSSSSTNVITFDEAIADPNNIGGIPLKYNRHRDISGARVNSDGSGEPTHARLMSSTPDLSMLEKTTGGDPSVDVVAKLKSQAMLKLSEINDFSPENLRQAVADFYDYFRQSRTFSAMNPAEISAVLTNIFEDLLFI